MCSRLLQRVPPLLPNHPRPALFLAPLASPLPPSIAEQEALMACAAFLPRRPIIASPCLPYPSPASHRSPS